jgi:hypothetical protein
MTQWAAFVKRLGVSGIEAPGSLVDVVDAITLFVVPPSAVAAKGNTFGLQWVPGAGWS